MEFKDLFKQLEELEGKSIDELDFALDLDFSLDSDQVIAEVKHEGQVVYGISLRIVDNKNETLSGSVTQYVEQLYALERTTGGVLRPRFTIDNYISNSAESQVSMFKLICEKLKTVYEAAQYGGVLLSKDPESFSYQFWENGGVAMQYLDPACNQTQYFYNGDELVKVVNRQTSITYDRSNPGSDVELVVNYTYDEKLGGLIATNSVETVYRKSGEILSRVDGNPDGKYTRTDVIRESINNEDVVGMLTTVMSQRITDCSRSKVIKKYESSEADAVVIDSEKIEVVESSYYTNKLAIIRNTTKFIELKEGLSQNHFTKNVYDNLDYPQVFSIIQGTPVENIIDPERTDLKESDPVDFKIEDIIVKIFTITDGITTITIQADSFLGTDKITPFDIEIKSVFDGVTFKMSTRIERENGKPLDNPAGNFLNVTVEDFDTIQDEFDELFKKFLKNIDHCMANNNYCGKVVSRIVLTEYINELIKNLNVPEVFNYVTLQVGKDEFLYEYSNVLNVSINTKFRHREQISDTEYIEISVRFYEASPANTKHLPHSVKIHADTKDLRFTCKLMINEDINRLSPIKDKKVQERIKLWEKQLTKRVKAVPKLLQNGENTHVKITPIKK